MRVSVLRVGPRVAGLFLLLWDPPFGEQSEGNAEKLRVVNERQCDAVPYGPRGGSRGVDPVETRLLVGQRRGKKRLDIIGFRKRQRFGRCGDVDGLERRCEIVRSEAS